MESTYNEFKQKLNEADVTIIGDSVKILFPKNVMFDFDKATVVNDFFPILTKLADVLENHKKTGLLINGHTDSFGNDDHNLELSRRRADSTKAVLIYDGIGASRLYSWGFGAKQPIASNATPDGRQLNRRVEFIVLYNYRHKGQ